MGGKGLTLLTVYLSFKFISLYSYFKRYPFSFSSFLMCNPCVKQSCLPNLPEKDVERRNDFIMVCSTLKIIFHTKFYK